MGFTGEQEKAISSEKRAVLVIAGPGSGKTTVLTERLLYLLRSGVPAASCLLLSFTRASSREMEKRFQKKSGNGEMPHFSTIHALCLGLLREERGIGKESLATLYEKMDWISSYFFEKGIQREEIEEMLSNYCNQIAYFKSITEAERLSFLREEKNEDFLSLYRYYEAIREQRRKLDFEDLLLEVLKELQKGTEISERWKMRYRHILVDEFQDLSLIQYAIIHALSERAEGIFAVGDEDQSIYGFRGASPGILFRFTEDFHLRMMPGICFGQRTISFYRVLPGSDQDGSLALKTQLETAYIEMPILLCYQALRDSNVRPYAVLGVSPRIDAAAFKKLKVESKQYLQLRRYDLAYEIGLGCEFYFPYFKMAPEIKWSASVLPGLSNTVAEGGEAYRAAIKGLTGQGFIFSLVFE